MKALLVLGSTLVGAGAAAFALSAVIRVDDAPSRGAARAALVASASGTVPTPGVLPVAGRRARYWWSVAEFERAVGPGSATRTARADRLARVAQELVREAGQGSRSSRSLSLTLLGLTRIADVYLGSAADRTPARGPAAALRAAVVLDPANSDAKANLELVLQTTASRPGALRPGPSRNQSKKPGSAPNPQTGSAPATGAGGIVQGPPVGY